MKRNVANNSIIHITEFGQTANLHGLPQQQRRWLNIKIYDGAKLYNYLYNAGNKGVEALLRRMIDGWVKLSPNATEYLISQMSPKEKRNMSCLSKQLKALCKDK